MKGTLIPYFPESEHRMGMCNEGNTFPPALTASKTGGWGGGCGRDLVINTAVLSLALCGQKAHHSPTVLMAVRKVEEPFQGSLASSIISGCARLGSAPGLILKPWRPRSPTATRGHKPIKSKPTSLLFSYFRHQFYQSSLRGTSAG